MTVLAEAPVRDSVLGRISLILGAFEGPQQQLTLADIIRRADLPRSTAHRLVSELAEHGCLERVDNLYQIGERLFWLAKSVPAHEELRQAALPHMVRLCRATGAAVRLSVLGNTEVLNIERLRASSTLTPQPLEHTREPLHATASGKMLLAVNHTSGPEWISPCLRRYTAWTVRNREELYTQLKAIRRANIAVCHQEHQVGITSIAVPLRLRATGEVAALSVAAPMTAAEVCSVQQKLMVVSADLHHS